MFNNIGGKIKTLAKVLCWTGIILSILVGNRRMANDEIVGLLTAVIGAFLSWISSFALYGFGELIVKTTEIAEKINCLFVDEDDYSYEFDEQQDEEQAAYCETDTQEGMNQGSSFINIEQAPLKK
ncbi:MAG: hypothetical protein IJZ08_09345 [Clostridia bacterium]|nr:hypothetical protein [Clostridia bacterium]